MSENQAHVQNELLSFVSEVGKTLQSHAVALHRHEENLKAAHKATGNHRDCIASLRRDLEGLGDLVNAQSRLLTSMQSVLLKVVTKLGMTDESPMPPPTAPN